MRLQAWTFPNVIEAARQGQIQLGLLRAIYGVASPVPTVSSSGSSSLGSLVASPGTAFSGLAANGNGTSLLDFLATPPPSTSGPDVVDPLASFDIFDPTLPLMPFTAAGGPSASAPLPAQPPPPASTAAGTIPTSVDLLALAPEDWFNALQELDQMGTL